MDYDSILTAVDSNSINRTEFYHTGKNVPDQGIPMVGRNLSVGSDDTVAAILLLLSLTLAVVTYTCRTTIMHRVSTLMHGKRKSYSTSRTNNSAEPYYTFLLTSITAFCLSIALFYLQVSKCTFTILTGIPYWLIGAFYVATMAAIYIKAWVYVLINWVFTDRETSSGWMHGYFFITSLTAYASLPLTIISILNNASAESVIQGIVFIVFCYEILLILKLFINFTPRKYGILAYFSYFCSVEVIPAIILWRILEFTDSWLASSHIIE